MPDFDVPMDPPPAEGSSSTGAGPSTQAGVGSLSKNKRKRSMDNSDPSSSRSKKSRTNFARRPKKPKKPSDWHLRKGEVPKAAAKTKLALELHLRVLWGLPDQTTVPPTVTAEDMAPFNKRFSSEAQVRSSVTASLDENSASIQDADVKVRELLDSLSDGGIISNNIRRISDVNLKLIFRTVACAGLRRWAPDVLGGNPDSMYNLLHEHIALTTFEQITVAQGYCHTGHIESFVRDFVLMRKMYRSFVFSYMHNMAKLEAKEKGSVEKGKKMTGVWKRRSSLADGRIDVFKACSFNERVVALAAETEAHSDDEVSEGNADSNTAIYHIKEKDGRSTKVTTFFRMADEQRIRMAKAKSRHWHKAERRRQDPAIPKKSELTTLPKQVPIDWFDPVYWNTYLTVRERAEYIKDGAKIALPLEEFCKTWEQCAGWKNLSEKEFMKKYGNAVLAQYKLPTDAELKQLERWDDAQEESEVEEELQDGSSGAE